MAIAVTACGGTAVVTSTSSPPPTTTTTTTTTSSTTTSTTTSTTSTTVTATSHDPLPDIGAEVTVPAGEGPFPAVVLVHGGGWVTGSPSVMRPLAGHLSEAGFLTVNTGYLLSTTEQAGFPGAVDDVACAVRLAAAHPDSDGTVAVVGHSAGAHLAAVVALTGDDYGGDCPIPGTGIPDWLVGLGGPYDIDRLGLAMLPFFGAGPLAAPEAWLAGNPQRLTDRNPGLVALIMHGEVDGIVEYSFASEFHDALLAAGADSTIEVVDGANHAALTDPDLVGDLIVVWLER